MGIHWGALIQPLTIICEACGHRAANPALPITWERGDAILVCDPCGERVMKFELCPVEWHALASRHGWWRTVLRPPRYDFLGRSRALLKSGRSYFRHRPPKARDFRADLPKLVDHCATRQELGDPEIRALRGHPPAAVLLELNRFSARSDQGFVHCAVAIAGDVLGPAAADFVRARFDETAPGAVLARWAYAAARCLPVAEAFQRVTTVIERTDPLKRAALLPALGELASPAALDWIEQTAPAANVGVEWGQAAARCEFDWARACAWLAAGRPLSLIALDALYGIVRRAEDETRGFSDAPKLAGPRPSQREAVEVLERYIEQDDAPRPMRTAGYVLGRLDLLLR